MSIAVVISTYNGETYIEEQLASIFKQTKRPDKVYIYDDKSTDNTCDCIRTFINRYNLNNNWNLIINKNNLGWERNFHRALSEVKDDLIFISDQDDIWNEVKIEHMVETMMKHHEIGVLASSYIPFYENNSTRRVSEHILDKMKMDGKVERVGLDQGIMNVERPGCTYVVRRTFIDEINNVWFEDVAHDMNLWSTGILLQKMYLIDEPLIRWRRYNSSASNPLSRNKKVSIIQKYYLARAEHALRNEDYLSRLLYASEKTNLFSIDAMKTLLYEKELAEEINKAYTTKSPAKLFKVYIDNKESFPSRKSILIDCTLLFAHKLKMV